ncbi:transporter substrate-binding domain-containing protein [Pseudomonas sp. TH43]|uniref:transporter substrate-binding domain-containing protein n=1 Tax=Pseudomonas sp. TH43 TaxID=2796407 RepID=UPI001911348B|nr:transporter substrate-binding domain-containing protein [Pseudomonas sp. TH43]MBK5374974.1 transporter substrate-binding domain-containing protein [Pseudomonas sp. TH43]
MGFWRWALILLATCGLTATAGETPKTLEILTRTPLENVQLRLDGADRYWLRMHPVLRMGVSGTDYPPFELTRNQHQLEGLSADYADLLAQLLGVRVEVLRYSDRAAAIAALKRGELDVLATSNNFELADPELMLSRAYAEDQPMLVTRVGEAPLTDLAGKRLAMAEDYLPLRTVQAFYPQTVIQRYPSDMDALGAVAFGGVDVYLGSLISASHQININYRNDVLLAGPSGLDANPFGFALRRADVRLKRIIDKALVSIPMDQRQIIEQRWSAGRADMAEHSRVQLSEGEQRWLDSHPRVRVGANEDFAPLSFFDADGRLTGLAAQLLNLISQRSGMTFDIIRGNSLSRQIEQLTAGELDVLPVITPSNELENELHFTRAYLINPFVIVKATTAGSPSNLDELAGKRLAIYRAHPLRAYLAEHAPQVRLIEVKSPAMGMKMVVNGQAEAALSSLVGARYLIARQYREHLLIATTVGDQPARIVLATSPQAPELTSILNKALLSIGPKEMDELVARWTHDVAVDDSYWQRHRREILQGFAGAACLLLLALGLIGFQRRQIRQRQQWLRQLQQAKDAADDASRAKTNFLAIMSHELRTPMNALLGMLQLAMKRADEGVTDRLAIQIAASAGEQLLALIGDILDIVRIESGHLSLVPERANLHDQVLSICRVFEGLARQKRLHWHIELDARSDVDVLIDPTRFKQVLSNLLSNAIKFTETGEVSLQLRVSTTETAQLAVSVVIEDSGIGISAQDQQRLFSPFVQAGGHSQVARSGSGLGLVISRSLCEMMGGELRLDSKPGLGTRVFVSLEMPMLEARVRNAALVPQVSLPRRALRILVVDDQPVNRLLLGWQLSELGHRTVDTEDGEQGLALWREQPFDVLITDCNMPRRNGYELAQEIRRMEAQAGSAPCLILGFTANAMVEERVRCLAAGMDDCLFKPIRLEDLSQALSRANPVDNEVGELCVTALKDLDLSALEQLAGDDRAMIDQLRTEVLRSLYVDLRRLDELRQAPDCGGLRDLAHHIKGGAQMVGAARVVSACADLEQACRDDEGVALVMSVDALREAMQGLAQRLQA